MNEWLELFQNQRPFFSRWSFWIPLNDIAPFHLIKRNIGGVAVFVEPRDFLEPAGTGADDGAAKDKFFFSGGDEGGADDAPSVGSRLLRPCGARNDKSLCTLQ